MKISAGVLVIDPVTSSLLTCHPTGSKFFKWKYNQKTSRIGSLDIPKGEIGEDEPPVQAAVRELFEETGIALDPSELTDLGQHKYTVNKDLHLFSTFKTVNLESLRCESYFEHHETLELLPEVNGYALITPEQSNMLYQSLEKVVKPLWDEIVVRSI